MYIGEKVFYHPKFQLYALSSGSKLIQQLALYLPYLWLLLLGLWAHILSLQHVFIIPGYMLWPLQSLEPTEMFLLIYFHHVYKFIYAFNYSSFTWEHFFYFPFSFLTTKAHLWRSTGQKCRKANTIFLWCFDLKNSSFLQNIFIRIARFIEGNNSLIIVTKNFHIMFD